MHPLLYPLAAVLLAATANAQQTFNISPMGNGAYNNCVIDFDRAITMVLWVKINGVPVEPEVLGGEGTNMINFNLGETKVQMGDTVQIRVSGQGGNPGLDGYQWSNHDA